MDYKVELHHHWLICPHSCQSENYLFISAGKRICCSGRAKNKQQAKGIDVALFSHLRNVDEGQRGKKRKWVWQQAPRILPGCGCNKKRRVQHEKWGEKKIDSVQVWATLRWNFGTTQRFWTQISSQFVHIPREMCLFLKGQIQHNNLKHFHLIKYAC